MYNESSNYLYYKYLLTSSVSHRKESTKERNDNYKNSQT